MSDINLVIQRDPSLASDVEIINSLRKQLNLTKDGEEASMWADALNKFMVALSIEHDLNKKRSGTKFNQSDHDDEIEKIRNNIKRKMGTYSKINQEKS